MGFPLGRGVRLATDLGIAVGELIIRLRPVRSIDRELSRRLDVDHLGSGSVRIDRDLARSIVAGLDHGVSVSALLSDLPMHDDWTRSEQAGLLRHAVAVYRPGRLHSVEAALRREGF